MNNNIRKLPIYALLVTSMILSGASYASHQNNNECQPGTLQYLINGLFGSNDDCNETDDDRYRLVSAATTTSPAVYAKVDDDDDHDDDYRLVTPATTTTPAVYAKDDDHDDD